MAIRNWEDIPPSIDERPAEAEFTIYGLSRSIEGNKVYVDFGDVLPGPLSMTTLTFRDNKEAWAAYCKGVKITVKIVADPQEMS